MPTISINNLTRIIVLSGLETAGRVTGRTTEAVPHSFLRLRRDLVDKLLDVRLE